MQDSRLTWDQSVSYGWRKGTVSNTEGRVAPGRQERNEPHKTLCCASTASAFSKLNGHTENKLAITGPQFLPFTLNKCGLVTWWMTPSKQNGVYTPLQKMRGILCCNRDLQAVHVLLWHMQHFYTPSFTACFFWYGKSHWQ